MCVSLSLQLQQQADVEAVDSMRVTVAELTNRLKDKESVINELSEQRAKLENYTKKTLHAVQTKYMVAVSSHRNQINEKQERVDLLEKKLKESRTSYSREQALMMSSFYEVSRCLLVSCLMSSGGVVVSTRECRRRNSHMFSFPNWDIVYRSERRCSAAPCCRRAKLRAQARGSRANGQRSAQRDETFRMQQRLRQLRGKRGFENGRLVIQWCLFMRCGLAFEPMRFDKCVCGLFPLCMWWSLFICQPVLHRLFDHAHAQVHKCAGRLLAYPVVRGPHEPLQCIDTPKVDDQLLVLGCINQINRTTTISAASTSTVSLLRPHSLARTVHRKVAQRSCHLRLQLDGFRARAVDDGLEAAFARDLDLVGILHMELRLDISCIEQQPNIECGRRTIDSQVRESRDRFHCHADLFGARERDERFDAAGFCDALLVVH